MITSKQKLDAVKRAANVAERRLTAEENAVMQQVIRDYENDVEMAKRQGNLFERKS